MKMKFVSDPRKEVLDHNLEATVNNLAEQTQNLELVLGSDGVSNIAGRDILQGEFFMINGVGYVSIKNIANGTKISEGINVVKKSLIEWMSERMSN